MNVLAYLIVLMGLYHCDDLLFAYSLEGHSFIVLLLVAVHLSQSTASVLD